MHALRVCLQLDELAGRHARLEAGEHIAPVDAGEKRALGVAIRITELDAHQEAVELRLGQRKGADLLGGILRGDDEEGLGELSAVT